MDVLAKLFGSAARVKLLRLFLFNPQHAFSVTDAATRAQVTKREARKEIQLLLHTGLLERNPRGRVARYSISPESPYINALQNLLLNAPMQAEEMYKRLRATGTIKLIVVSGVFVGEWESALDLLVVGERLKERALLRKIKTLEAEVGKEVRFTTLSTQDFFYRLNMSDRLLRDIFDYPHKIVFDRLDIGLV